MGKGSESSETAQVKSEKSGEGGDVISAKPIQGLDGRSEVRLSTPGGEVMHSVDVTDAMRRSVLVEGQPLFQKAEDWRGCAVSC